MNTRRHHDDDDPPNPPRPWRLYWIAAAVLLFIGLAGGGIALGTAGPGLPAADAEPGDADASAETETDAENECDDDRLADPAASLCYAVPDGWEQSSIELGVGPSSSIVNDSVAGTAQIHFGPLSEIPLALPAEPIDAAPGLLGYACELFGAVQCDPVVESRDLDGHEAVTAFNDGNGPYVTVTIVDVGDGYGYAMSVVDPAELPQSADTDAVHDSLTVL